MRFRRHIAVKGRALAVAAASLLLAAGAAMAEMGTAIVPVTTIFPGETIVESRVKAVDVTNPRLAPGYARSLSFNIKVENLFNQTGNATASTDNPWLIGRTVWAGAKATF